LLSVFGCNRKVQGSRYKGKGANARQEWIHILFATKALMVQQFRPETAEKKESSGSCKSCLLQTLKTNHSFGRFSVLLDSAVFRVFVIKNGDRLEG
jgi:hypothetical protein